MADDQIHWFSIVNSLMIVLFLSGACRLPRDSRLPLPAAGAQLRRKGTGIRQPLSTSTCF